MRPGSTVDVLSSALAMYRPGIGRSAMMSGFELRSYPKCTLRKDSV